MFVGILKAVVLELSAAKKVFRGEFSIEESAVTGIIGHWWEREFVRECGVGLGDRAALFIRYLDVCQVASSCGCGGDCRSAAEREAEECCAVEETLVRWTVKMLGVCSAHATSPCKQHPNLR